MLLLRYDRTPEKESCSGSVDPFLPGTGQLVVCLGPFEAEVRENRGLCGRTADRRGLKAIVPANRKEPTAQQPKFFPYAERVKFYQSLLLHVGSEL